jgi:solute:Na+ symporter, SSS family
MKSIIALTIISCVIVGTAAIGVLGVRKIKMDPAQFIVGGRSLGAIFLWLLMAGEVYTSFTFLGAAGWAYSKGAPAFYIICYLTVACILSFFYLPPIWRTARRHGLLTSADYFAVKYQSPLLGMLVALVGVVFLVPYITLQLTGIQILLQIAGYGAIDSILAAGLAFGLIVAFVLVSGLRGAAWASLIKDALVLGAVLFAGIVLPMQFFGSPKAVIDQVLKVQPHWMTLVGGTDNFGTVWFVSTVLLTGFGGFMWPHSIAAVYAAKSEEAVRRNAIILPFYQIMLLLVYFAGFTALLLKPGLKGSDVDQSFMSVVQEHYGPWVLGVVGAAGCLAALIPAAAQILAAASLLSRNLSRFGLPQENREQRTAVTRLWIVLLAVFAFGLWLFARTTLVSLLLIAYSGITQIFPGLVLSLRKHPPHPWSVAVGILVGLALLILCAATGTTIIQGVNFGLVALIANTASLLGLDLMLSQVGAKNLGKKFTEETRSSGTSAPSQ